MNNNFKLLNNKNNAKDLHFNKFYSFWQCQEYILFVATVFSLIFYEFGGMSPPHVYVSDFGVYC